MENLANLLIERGCSRAAAFLNTYSNTLVTFARLSLNGIHVPWNSNMIERLMGEISKRVKHKWMRWTTRGLEAILRFILVRYTSPWLYRRFRNEYLGLHGLSSIAIQISIDTITS
jgi:transposase-like protein